MEEQKETLKYLVIKESIKNRISQGVYEEKLPGERVLAADFGYSYMTVRKAIDALVSEDVLYRLPAKGTFINKGEISGKKTFNIGFFLEPRIKGGISSPYYSLIFKGIEDALKKEGYSLFFFTDLDMINPLKHGKKYDGLVLSCFPAIEESIKKISVFSPVVIIDNAITESDIPYVGIDNRAGIYDAVDYLFKIGHKDICFVSGVLDSPVGFDRLEGYKAALTDNGIAFKKAMVFEGDYDFKSGLEAASKFLSAKNPPSAIVCANDSMAFGVIEGARKLGKRIPDDVSVIGFDDIEFAAQSSPALTTIKAPIDEIVRYSIDVLLSGLKGTAPIMPDGLLPARLVVRDTCRSL